VLINNINLEHTAVCNNACWALGEISTRVGEAITPYVSAIMTPLTGLIRLNNINRGLLENIAISIGRLADVVPRNIHLLLLCMLSIKLSRFYRDDCSSR